MELSEKLRQRMIQVDNEIQKAFVPQFSGHSTRPVGSQWDYDASIAQARMDFKRLICPTLNSTVTPEAVEEAFAQASISLKASILKKNERYKKDYMLVRDQNHGQDRLQFDREMYLRSL